MDNNHSKTNHLSIPGSRQLKIALGIVSVVMVADKVGPETLLSQIVAMVAAAQRSGAPIQKLADIVAGYFVPVVIAVALAAFGIWYFFGPEPRLAYALIVAVSVLIIACPAPAHWALQPPCRSWWQPVKGRPWGFCLKTPSPSRFCEKSIPWLLIKPGP